jgi:hypothetical protein
VIAIRVLARAVNMLPSVLADIAEDAGHELEATKGRWLAASAQSRAVILTRTIELPAVPREGEEIWLHPYTESVRVDRVTWNADPDPDDMELHIEMWVQDMDLDVIGDDEDALEMFRQAGWVIEPLNPERLESDE